jgi:hypothetical protein
MKRHAIVAGEPDHTGLGWLSRELQRLFSRPLRRQPHAGASASGSTSTAKLRLSRRGACGACQGGGGAQRPGVNHRVS